MIDFIDEALGGAERESDADGLVWLPAISVDDPEIDVFVTFDDRDVDAVAIGIGAVFRSSDPSTETTISVPLFLAAKEGRSIASPLHLGHAGARLKLSTSIVVDDSAPTPGEAHLGSIAIAIDLPTAAGDADPTFGVTFGELQLPGATVPTDVSVAAENVDELDEAIVELVLSLVASRQLRSVPVHSSTSPDCSDSPATPCPTSRSSDS